MERDELIQLARVGAQARLDVLQAEIAAIHRQFPELARRTQSGRTAPRPVNQSKVRPRRKLSAVARSRIAAAQRKRWAAWRKRKTAA